ncbi:class I SAM-dependent methyltransferase [Ornithinimicrobium humiphilum]|uniref:Cyclopropane-fatty-acyl-phospholipid synthase n=1 Tax=Ornithinimicrobium humiphilum TaxID=125288 RepID=A0A543KRH1_9MICO|nr:class I SAM-dependent methyltransferase [Ornithinimicrobium humiphilum]TQM97661.1 cyclopropane-fatty-acyl-phospholipid synthase [Ornithinimicrobium humiphilum]
MTVQSVAEAIHVVLGRPAAVGVVAHDGSTAGSLDGTVLRLHSPRAISYIVSHPGQVGFARAYLQGDLTVDGMNEAYPYEELKLLQGFNVRIPPPRELPDLVRVVRAAGISLEVPELPELETPSELRKLAHGIRHGRRRDAEAIRHHYDVSNRFYEMLLGPSMTYTCAVFPTEDSTLEEAQEEKYDLVCRKLGLRPGMRLLDVGCGWGGMVRHAVRHYGVTALGVTLSEAQAGWARERIEQEGLTGAEVRHCDYRDVAERGFDAVSSIGLTEHIGVRNYRAYFSFLRDRLRDGGRLLNHCITWRSPDHVPMRRGDFVARYVFPDGELASSGRIVTEMERVGLEVHHHENLRQHYARTCGAWCENLSEHWDECVAEVGLDTARVWGLYLAGSRYNFERNTIQLHQVLATRTSAEGEAGYPLRPDFA